MINLLPTDKKRDIRAARTNVVLLRYNFFIVVGILFLAATCALFYFVLNNARATAVSTSTDNTVRAQSFAKIRADASEYQRNLSIANKILGNSVNYSAFLFSLTKLLPDGVILEGITLNASSFSQQTTFIARATTFEKATELKESFQKSDLLTNVFFQSLSDNSSTDAATNDPHPISVTISAKVNKVTPE